MSLANRILLAYFAIFYMLPFLYVQLNDGYSFKFYTVENEGITIVITALIFLAVMNFKPLRFNPVTVRRRSFIWFWNSCVAGFIILAFYLPNDFRYDDASSVFKVIFKSLYTILVISFLLHRDTLELKHKVTFLLAMILNLSGIAMAISTVALAFISVERFRVRYVPVVALFAYVVFQVGVMVKTGEVLKIESVVTLFKLFVERLSAEFVASNRLMIIDIDYGDRFAIFFEYFRQRWAAILGYHYTPSEYLNLAHFTREIVGDWATEGSGGMPTSIVGGGYFLFGYAALTTSLVYLWVLKSVLNQIPGRATLGLSIAFAWLLQFLFSNPADILLIASPAALMFGITIFLSMIRVK